jgi:hypothetical protein
MIFLSACDSSFKKSYKAGQNKKLIESKEKESPNEIKKVELFNDRDKCYLQYSSRILFEDILLKKHFFEDNIDTYNKLVSGFLSCHQDDYKCFIKASNKLYIEYFKNRFVNKDLNLNKFVKTNYEYCSQEDWNCMLKESGELIYVDFDHILSNALKRHYSAYFTTFEECVIEDLSCLAKERGDLIAGKFYYNLTDEQKEDPKYIELNNQFNSCADIK